MLNSHTPRKRFGQNFLQDMRVVERILQMMQPKSSENIIEIGPGQAALTQPLMHIVDKLTAIEIDRDLQNYLMRLPLAATKLNLINADALQVDYAQFGDNLRIIGNLPYNISTPILFHLLSYASHITDMHFMLQKEVVSRLAAQPGCKAYGRLSVMVQYFCEVEELFDVPPEAFNPRPKVQSAIVKLTPYKQSPYDKISVPELEKVVAQAFGMRRKTLANNFKGVMDSDTLKALGIDPTKRPEQLTIDEYVTITRKTSEI